MNEVHAYAHIIIIVLMHKGVAMEWHACTCIGKDANTELNPLSTCLLGGPSESLLYKVHVCANGGSERDGWRSLVTKC